MLKYLLAVIAILVVNASWASTTNNDNDHNKKDGVLMAWLMVLDKNEINAANLALKKSTNHAVIKYADLMIKDHTAHLKHTHSLSQKLGVQPHIQGEALSLKESGMKEANELRQLNGHEFDKNYMTAMVKGHTMADEKLTQEISANDSNEQVKQYLQQTDETVEMHLKKAKEVLAQLK